MEIKNKDGLLLVNKIEFNNILKRKVIKNNSTSGKITLPSELIGNEVYIIVP